MIGVVVVLLEWLLLYWLLLFTCLDSFRSEGMINIPSSAATNWAFRRPTCVPVVITSLLY